MDWTKGRLPLKGLRVLDWTVYWAGPYLSMMLHDLGAEVIKVESPSSWDPMRTVIDVNRGVRGSQKPMTPHERSNVNQHFNEWNRGKLGLAVELRDERGRQAREPPPGGGRASMGIPGDERVWIRTQRAGRRWSGGR